MPLPFAPLLNDILVALPSAAYTTASGSITFSTNQVTYMALDITLTSFTGGTTPSISFFIDRLGPADGVWYNVYSSGALTGATTISMDIGPGFAAATGTTHAVFTTQGRFRWAFGGAVSPTAVTYSVSAIGR